MVTSNVFDPSYLPEGYDDTVNLSEYTKGANLVLAGMGELPASEKDMAMFFQAGYDADTAAEDFAYYRANK
jgi:hypothetical protein